MSFMKPLYIKRRAIQIGLVVSCIISALIINPAIAETLRIEVNKASILKLTQTPSTIIIGNPALADVTPQENNILVLVGKASGRTNIIILDEVGDIMHNYDIAVQEEQDGNLTLYKAGKQWSYSCAPYCERVINPNDDAEAFSGNLGQVMAKMGQMSNAAVEASATVDSDVGGLSYALTNGAGGNVVANNGTQSGAAGNIPVEELQTFTILPPQ